MGLPTLPRRRWFFAGIVLPLGLVAASLHGLAPAGTAEVASVPPAASGAVATTPATASSPTPAVTAALSEPAAPTQTLAPSPPAGEPPTPTSQAASTSRVGIQVGHWLSHELPDELKRLRTSTGAFAAGYSEVEINLDIARRVVALLESRGIIVDVLPATVPPSYEADAFVAIHADGSPSAGARGFKLATPWRTSRAAQQLLDVMTAEYGAATGMPQDGAVTFNMRGYYAFSYRRHTHAIAKTTPAVIIEMGFLTNAKDRAMLIDQPDTVATGIANGIVRYLNERDPNDAAALEPPDFKVHRPASAEGVDVRAAPDDQARVLLRAGPDRRLFIFQERDGWYQAVVRGEWRVVGWVRKELVVATEDPPPTPPPATDS